MRDGDRLQAEHTRLPTGEPEGRQPSSRPASSKRETGYAPRAETVTLRRNCRPAKSATRPRPSSIRRASSPPDWHRPGHGLRLPEKSTAVGFVPHRDKAADLFPLEECQPQLSNRTSNLDALLTLIRTVSGVDLERYGQTQRNPGAM